MKPTEELPGRLLNGGPKAVPLEALVVGEERRQDVVLDLAARRRETAGDKPHHIRVTVEFDESVDVILGETSQQQVFGLKKDLHQRVLLRPRAQSFGVAGGRL